MNANSPITKSFVYLAFIVSLVALMAALTLTILLGAQNYVGFSDNNAITVSSCADTYTTTKYAGLSQLIGTSFIGTVIAFGMTIGIFVVMLIWVLRVSKDHNPESSIERIVKYILYLLSNVAILAEIPCFGYHFTYLVEINKCATTTYNQAQVIGIFCVSLILLVTSLFYYILITLVVMNLPHNEQRYRDVSSQPTEPNQNQIKQKYYRYQPKQQPKSNANNIRNNEHERHQHTKQNLYHSPTKDPKYFYTPNDDPQTKNRYPSNQRSAQQNDINKYVPQESFHQISPQKQHKRKNFGGPDDEEFNNQRNRYMNRNQGRSILPRDGFEQKPNQRNDNYYGGEPRKRIELSPQKKISRQGQLVSHIRSKYGN